MMRQHKNSDRQNMLATGISRDGNTGGKGFKLEKVLRLCRRQRRGAAVVEFAVVVPVFVIVILGMIEVGRAVMVQQILTNASREGARRAVLDGMSETDVQQAVVDYMSRANISIDATNVTVVSNPPVSPDYANSMTVTVTVPFSQVSWLPSPIYFKGSSGTLVATSTMRQEVVN